MSIHVICVRQNNCTALHYASYAGKIGAVKILIKRGALVSAADVVSALSSVIKVNSMHALKWTACMHTLTQMCMGERSQNLEFHNYPNATKQDKDSWAFASAVYTSDITAGWAASPVSWSPIGRRDQTIKFL